MTADILLADIVQQRDLNETEARALVDGMRRDVTDLGERIATAYLGRSWLALGYASWDALCDAEFDGARLRIPREQRAEQVQSLRSAGLSTRAIGSALGIGVGTVHRDLAPSVPDGADGRPAAVQSLDGRTRPASQPPRPQSSPAPSGPSRPAADTARSSSGSGAGELGPAAATAEAGAGSTSAPAPVFDPRTGEVLSPPLVREARASVALDRHDAGQTLPIEQHPDYQAWLAEGRSLTEIDLSA